MKTQFLVVFLLINTFLLNGCKTVYAEFSYKYISFSSSIYNKTNLNDIVIYNEIKDIPEKYEELGVFKINGLPDYDILKVVASEHGGHGLLKTTRGIILIRLLNIDVRKGDSDVKT